MPEHMRKNKAKREVFVKLRAFEKEDIAKRHKVADNPATLRLLTSSTVMPRSLEEETAIIERCLSPKDKDSFYTFAIENSRGELIGSCGYKDVSPKNRRCKISIAIYGEQNCGKGYGTAAMRKLLDFLFLEKNMHKVWLTVFAFNPRAVACYRKLGFREEGRLREHVYRDGKYHDAILMGIFKREYRAD